MSDKPDIKDLYGGNDSGQEFDQFSPQQPQQNQQQFQQGQIYWDPSQNPTFWDPRIPLPRRNNLEPDNRTRKQLRTQKSRWGIRDNNPIRSLSKHFRGTREAAPKLKKHDMAPGMTRQQWEKEEKKDKV